jgi:methyltransferase (TIGR00027 family)
MTALGVAYIRATESARPDRLFSDPLASLFVEASGWAPAREQMSSHEVQNGYWAGLLNWVVVRTRFLDDLLERAAASGCRQFVLLGAGLDARAFRLGWPAATLLFELDLPDVLGFKEEVITSSAAVPACARTVVPGDLQSDDWPSAIVEAGFDPQQPTTWIAEGLLIYFSDEQNAALLERLSGLSAPGSAMGLTLRTASVYANGDEHDDAADPLASTSNLTSMWKSATPEDPVAWLASFGWQAKVSDGAERAVAYGRPMPPGSDAASRASYLVRATRS